MKVMIEKVDDPKTMINICRGLSVADKKTMNDCAKSSAEMWIGMVDGVAACVWGVTLPSLLSDRAYLWLWTNDEIVKGHPFVFIRRAQIIIKQLLEEYEAVVGVCELEKNDGVRWLKLLGAKFMEPENGLLPFIIKRT